MLTPKLPIARRTCRAARRAAHLSLALGALCATSPAHAHGAFPAARQIVADPSDASRIWVRATHGVLTSSDAGTTWRWLCTKAAGYGGTEEPTLAVTGDGTALMGAFDGLLASSDHGCGWAIPSPSLERTVAGVAVDPKNPSRVVVLTSEGGAGGTFASELWQSLDAGATFQSLAKNLDPGTLYLSVGISPSDPTRLYLTGLPGSGGAKSVVLRSSSSGQSWEAPVELATSAGATAQIAGVHPTNPDVVYVRANLVTASASEGALLASSDGAQSFGEVLKKAAPLMGFTLSPDGSQAFAAYGNPRGGVVVDTAALGLYRASSADNAFTRVREGPVACASFVAGELWACTSQFDDGFELGRSSDQGQSFSAVMALAELGGPLECPAGSTVATTCTATDWDDVCRDIGKCGAQSGDGDAGDDGGCGCRSAAGRGGGGLAWLALLALAALRRRRPG